VRDVGWHHALSRCCARSRHRWPHQTGRHRRNRGLYFAKVQGVRRAVARPYSNIGHKLRVDRVRGSVRPLSGRSRHPVASNARHLRIQRRTPVRQTQPPQRTRLTHMERRPRQLAHPTPRRHHHHTGCLTGPGPRCRDRRTQSFRPQERCTAPPRTKSHGVLGCSDKSGGQKMFPRLGAEAPNRALFGRPAGRVARPAEGQPVANRRDPLATT
jgi:hypothetical protein